MNFLEKEKQSKMDNLHFRACVNELADSGGVYSKECPWRKSFGEAQADLETLKKEEKGLMVPNFFIQAEEADKAPLGK